MLSRRRKIWLLPHLLFTPSSLSKLSLVLNLSVCRRSTDGIGGEGAALGSNQVTRQRGSLVLFKSLNILCWPSLQLKMNCEWFWQVTWALTLFRHKLYHLFSALHPPSLYPPLIKREQINFEGLKNIFLLFPNV
jgi:hypothetical protein